MEKYAKSIIWYYLIDDGSMKGLLFSIVYYYFSNLLICRNESILARRYSLLLFTLTLASNESYESLHWPIIADNNR